jgi:methionyl-tRNA formyltransferase
VGNPGTIETDGRHYLRVAAANGNIDILQLQIPGKKRMSVEDFLRGHDITDYKFD